MDPNNTTNTNTTATKTYPPPPQTAPPSQQQQPQQQQQQHQHHQQHQQNHQQHQNQLNQHSQPRSSQFSAQPYSAASAPYPTQQYYLPQQYNYAAPSPQPQQHQQQQQQQQPQPQFHPTQAYSPVPQYAPPSDQHSSTNITNLNMGSGSHPATKQNSAAAITTSPPLRREPTRMVQREVALSEDGNFVIDVPVAKTLLQEVAHKDAEEFTHLRYTAATCDPNEFPNHYTLRAKQLGRRTRIAVVVTMYNEDDVLFGKTMTAIMKNIAYLCSGRCAGWTKDSWKEIVITIVSDGRSKVNPLTLNVLSVMGCYMDGLAKASVNGKPVTGHVFEFTNQVTVGRDLQIRRPNDGAHDGLTLVPCQTIFLLKEKNAKKINSHRWFFKAVCESLQPEVTILIDVGTKPTKESFYHLYKAFDTNPNVGGACGEIAAELGKYWHKVINPIVAVQNFEYKMSNILDKPLESVFGYISVLPGAFSAYRYTALQGAPLACYFKGENPHGRNVSEANMYLAEDRILCFELVMKRDAQWVLKYVKSARAETDVPSAFDDLIKQRRRWLNGSFFASVHACLNYTRIFTSGHTATRKAILFTQFIYNVLTLLFSWFNLGNFFLAFYFLFNIASSQEAANCSGGLVENANDPFNPYGPVVFTVLRTLYIGALGAMIIASMGNRPEASKLLYNGIAILFALIMGMMLFMSIWTIKISITTYIAANTSGVKGFIDYIRNNPSFRDLVISLLSTYGLYLLASLMHLDPYHIVTCLLQYMFMLPSFVNILMVYAFSNLHDVSWGTKGIDAASDLGHVEVKKNAKGEKIATVELPSDPASADQIWENHRKELMKQALSLRDRKESGGSSTVTDDFFKQFRTNTLLLWFFTNGLLVYIFTTPSIVSAMFPAASAKNGSAVNPYLTFLFWSVAFMSAVRWICSTIYLVGWIGESVADAGKRNVFHEMSGGGKGKARV